MEDSRQEDNHEKVKEGGTIRFGEEKEEVGILLHQYNRMDVAFSLLVAGFCTHRECVTLERGSTREGIFYQRILVARSLRSLFSSAPRHILESLKEGRQYEMVSNHRNRRELRKGGNEKGGRAVAEPKQILWPSLSLTSFNHTTSSVI